jgi:CheY-like chemotaxis protein
MGTCETSSRRILVVDDDRGIRDGLATLLEGEGYAVRRAENGQVALDIIRGSVKPDLVLLDLMMPILSGFELLEMLEDGDPDLDAIPIFVVSAFNAPVTATARGGGVRRCFGKPFDTEALLGAIRERFAADEARL